jgi:ribosomal protein L23
MFSKINNTSVSIEIESLYIAHVFPNIHKKKIAQLFEKLFLAKIKGVDFVTKIGRDGKAYNSAYIHIESWVDTSAAKHFQEKIRTDSEALLVYDEPWYWIVNENKSTEKSNFIQKAEKEKFEEEETKTNNLFKEMQMSLDILEKICAKNRKVQEIYEEIDIDNEIVYNFTENKLGFSEEEEYQIIKELSFQERDEEYEFEKKK